MHIVLYSGQYHGVSAGGRGFRSHVGEQKGKSVQIGISSYPLLHKKTRFGTKYLLVQK